MRYPHTLTLTRAADDAAPAAQDPETGVMGAPEGEPVTVYAGRADVQDATLLAPRDDGGLPVADADAVAFLARRGAAARVRVGDRAVVRWDSGAEQTAEVRGRRRLDDTVALRYLGAPGGEPDTPDYGDDAPAEPVEPLGGAVPP